MKNFVILIKLKNLSDQLKKLAKKLKSLMEIKGNFRRAMTVRKKYVAYATFKDKRIKNPADDGQTKLVFMIRSLSTLSKPNIDWSSEFNNISRLKCNYRSTGFLLVGRSDSCSPGWCCTPAGVLITTLVSFSVKGTSRLCK